MLKKMLYFIGVFFVIGIATMLFLAFTYDYNMTISNLVNESKAAAARNDSVAAIKNAEEAAGIAQVGMQTKEISEELYAKTLFNAAEIYQKYDKAELAYPLYDTALKIWAKDKTKNRLNSAICLYNLSYSFENKHDHETAANYLFVAYQIFKASPEADANIVNACRQRLEKYWDPKTETWKQL
jgi:tetratricopeptide (TPR) repeat protein